MASWTGGACAECAGCWTRHWSWHYILGDKSPPTVSQTKDFPHQSPWSDSVRASFGLVDPANFKSAVSPCKFGWKKCWMSSSYFKYCLQWSTCTCLHHRKSWTQSRVGFVSPSVHSWLICYFMFWLWSQWIWLERTRRTVSIANIDNLVYPT